jgi:hypothetical protein
MLTQYLVSWIRLMSKKMRNFHALVSSASLREVRIRGEDMDIVYSMTLYIANVKWIDGMDYCNTVRLLQCSCDFLTHDERHPE